MIIDGRTFRRNQKGTGGCMKFFLRRNYLLDSTKTCLGCGAPLKKGHTRYCSGRCKAYFKFLDTPNYEFYATGKFGKRESISDYKRPKLGKEFFPPIFETSDEAKP